MIEAPLSDPVRSSAVGATARRRRGAAGGDPLGSRLGRAVEIGLILSVLIPPFVFGGREAYGQLVLAALVLVTATLWIIRRIGLGPYVVPFHRPEVLLALLALGLTVASWIPLPPSVVRTLSPGIGRVLPGWSDGTLGPWSAGGWRFLSLAPGLSVDGAVLFVLYALLFWITLDTIRTAEASRRLLTAFFITGVGVAAVGILHYLFWNGKFYGLWELWWVEPECQVRAPFTNRNHFAGFLALTVAPGMATVLGLFRRWKNTSEFAMGRRDRSGRPHELTVMLSGLGLALILAGIFLSQSRGGTIVGVLALAAMTLGLFAVGLSRASSLGVVALLVLGGLGIVVTFAREDPFQRNAAMLEGNESLDDLSNQRLRLWQADLHALLDFPLTGSGVGSHAYVYPLYLDKAQRVTFTHAENGYVQILVECGLAGVTLLILAIYLVSAWCVHNLRAPNQSRRRPVALAVSVSLMVVMIHGIVDFVWYVPAYAAAIAVLAGAACAMYRARSVTASKAETPVIRTRAWTIGTYAWGSGLAFGALALWVVVGQHFVNAARAEYAWNSYFHLLPDPSDKGTSPDGIATVQQRVDLLAETCRYGSADPDHFYRLGLANLELFYQKQGQGRGTFSLAEARALVRARNLREPGEVHAWLKEIYGPDLALVESAQASFRRSLELCPLNGQAYVRLAELDFLDHNASPIEQNLCQEALLVRPFDADVQLQVGFEAWVEGDLPTASQSWGDAFRRQPDSKWKFLPLVADYFPPGEAADFVPLDFEGLKWLAGKEAELGRTDGLPHVIEQAQRVIESDAERSKSSGSWIALHELYRDANLDAGAEACLRRALQRAPAELGVHLRLVRWLMAHERWDDALTQAQVARKSCTQTMELQVLFHDILLRKSAPAAGNDAAKARPGNGLHTGSGPP